MLAFTSDGVGVRVIIKISLQAGSLFMGYSEICFQVAGGQKLVGV